MASHKKETNSVTVGVRIRPRNDKEIQEHMQVFFAPSPDNLNVQELNEDNHIVKHWSYDNVFGPDHNNKFIFDAMGAKLVDSALDGYNSVLFMYGQTSSGKTFTLFGGGSTAGLVQHSMEYLHAKIMASTDTEYVVKMTYAELYNEELKDLLSPNQTSESSKGLNITDDPNFGPVIQNITEVPFQSATQIKDLLLEAEKNRHFGVTNMNAHSSRSHVMVRLSIEIRKVGSKPANPLRANWGKDKPNAVSTLNLVDLAGSERANKSGTSGQALKEGAFINKSLLTLGTVISNLTEGKSGIHINYRDSKLTRLLSSALGGNAKTCMITCISPASGNVSESISTLKFASRAKRIVNEVQKNEILNVKTLSHKLTVSNMENEALRAQLEISRQLGFVPDDERSMGETLKAKAVHASRNMRNLRFLMTNTPKLVQSLKKIGSQSLAKKVLADFKLAKAGRKELQEIIDEHAIIINTHFAADRSMVGRLNVLLEDNFSERIMGKEEEEAAAAEEDNEDLGEDDDVDTEELRERVEHLQIDGEDLRGKALRRIYSLQADLLAAAQRERCLQEQIDKQKTHLVEHEETIKRHITNELTQQNSLHSTQQELDTSLKTAQGLRTRINALELQVSEREATISSREHDVLARDTEILRLKSQIEQLDSDLAASVSSRKLFEEETSRARQDMRAQMDKMRSNLHQMLQQGGEEAKVIESQNEMLQRELDSVKDYLEEETKSKDRLEVEMSHLRGNIAMLQDEQRVHMGEMDISKKENAELLLKVRDARFKLSKAQSSLTVSEEHNMKMQRQYDEEIAALHEQLATQQADFRARHDQTEAKCLAAVVDMERTQLELAAALEQIEAKAQTITRLELTLSADTARLEKKLHLQNNHNDDMAVELTNANAHMHAMVSKHAEEVKALKHKIEELQSVVDVVNQRIEEQVRELCDHHSEDEADLYSVGGSYYRRDSMGSGMSRQSSFMESPMVERSVSFTLGPRRHLPDFFSAEAVTPNRGYINSTLTTPMGTAERKMSDDAADYEDVRAVDLNSPLPAPILNTLSPMKSALKSAQSPRLRNNNNNNNNNAPRELDINEDESSPQFLRLCEAMQLLTTSLRHGIEEERIIRTFATGQHFRFIDQCQSDQATIQYLEDKKEYLEEKTSSQQDSLQFSKELERKATERITAAEVEYQAMKAQYIQSVRNEQAAQGNAAKFEQMYLDLRVQLEKARKEKKQYMDSGMDFNVRCAELEAKMEDALEAKSVLESQFQLAQQELGVLKVEREELLKRFLRNGTYPPPTPNASSPRASVASTGDGTSVGAETTYNGHGHGGDRTPARAAAPSGLFVNTSTAPFSPSASYRGTVQLSLASLLPTPGGSSAGAPPAQALSRAPSSTLFAPPAPPQPHVPYVPPAPQPGMYSTLSPMGKKPSEAYISLFGASPQSSNF